VGVIHFDSRLCLTFCNERFAAMVGSTVQALQGLDLQRLRDPAVLPAMRQALAGESGTYDGGYRTTLSHIDVWIAFRANPLRDASGAIIGGIGIVEDVGEKRRAEDSLRQSERNFRTMADFTYDWEYWQGADGRIVYMTPSVERITGYGAQAFADDPSLLQQIVHPDDRQEFQEHLNQAVFHHEHMVDFRIVRRDGQVRWIAHGCQAVVGEEGEALGRRVSNRDVTERKTLEAELQALNSRLEARVQEELASNREKDQLLIQQSRLAAMGEMVHNIAHQWRQPLNALGLVIANIRDDFEFGQLDGTALDESVGRALKLLQRMSTTIDDFRNFFRPDRDPADFDLGAAVEDAAFIMEASLKNNDIGLERAVEPGLRAWGFHGQFSQAVLNVLANAKEVLQERHVRPARIRLQVSRRDAQVEVTVEDNAGGIPDNVLGHIFEPYFTTKEQGSGIGLYMTKMILERSMHGKIRAENTAEGARFVLTVPLYTLPPTAPMQ
jgi:PAS domain S-box-containing protein